MPSSDKANRRRKEEGKGEGKEEKSFRPKLSDFKRKIGEGEDKGSLPHSRGIDNMKRRERLEEKSFQARRMDDIFEDFRNNIESILNPWSSSYLWHSPSKLEMGEEEEEAAEEKDEEIRRTPLYDMVDKEDRYKLEVELPGIDR